VTKPNARTRLHSPHLYRRTELTYGLQTDDERLASGVRDANWTDGNKNKSALRNRLQNKAVVLSARRPPPGRADFNAPPKFNGRTYSNPACCIDETTVTRLRPMSKPLTNLSIALCCLKYLGE